MLLRTTLISLALAAALGGCLSDGGSSSSQTGVLLDSAVDGVSYSGNRGSQGITAGGGHFNYVRGETLTFSIGTLELGRSLGAAVVTPANFVGADGQLTGHARLALRVLQSLDDNNDPDDGIVIPAATRSAITQPLALASASESDALQAVQQARPTLTALVTENDALDHFADSVIKQGIPLAAQTPSAGTPVKLTLMHTNDTHSHIETFTPSDTDAIAQGGVARRKTLVDQTRNEAGSDTASRNTLLVDAGDFSQGTIFYNAWEGSESIMAMNAMHYDAAGLGNHEFDLGPARLARALKGEDITIDGTAYPTEAPTFPLVASNLDFSAEASLKGLLRKFAVIEKGGQKYGIIGVVTEELPIIANTGSNIRLLDYVASVNRTAALLAALGVDKIIVLSHYGYAVDLSKVADLRGVDIIVSAHDHALLGDSATIDAATRNGTYTQTGAIVGPYPTVRTDKDGRNVLLVSAYEWGRWLGRIDVDFDAHGEITASAGRSLFVDGRTVVEDSALASAVAAYKAPVAAFSNVVIGTSSMAFSASRGTASPFVAGVRTAETTLGNLVTDLMQSAAAGSDQAVAAFTNGGGLRADIAAGNVTFGQALSVLPFGNTLFVIDLSGQEVIELAETSAGKVGSGGFLQVSSALRIDYCADAASCSNPLVAGGRVTSVKVNGTPVDPAATYRLATNNFTAGGGDGYAVLANACQRPGNYCRDTGIVLLDLLVNELKTGNPLSATLDGRITRH